MDNRAFYNSPEWHAARDLALARDGHKCSVARLLGGDCHDRLDVHHLQSLDERPDLALDLDNLLTVCASHHPTLEAVRRLLRVMRLIDLPPCGHRHPYPQGRIDCDRRRRDAELAKRAARLAA
jgi:5-methylcytosine-specific restriction endonuclease McrA